MKAIRPLALAIVLLNASGSLNTVIQHEMGHVLGFSTGSWNPSGGQRVCAQNAPTPQTPVSGLDTHFSCTQAGAVNNARAMFDSIGGSSYTGGNKVPLENCLVGVPASCGTGQLYSHWREGTFFNELMTGYFNSGTVNPLSVLTIALFEDNGYQVNYAAAQGYSRAFTVPAAARGPLIDLGDDVLRVRAGIIDDRTGRIVRVPLRQ